MPSTLSISGITGKKQQLNGLYTATFPSLSHDDDEMFYYKECQKEDEVGPTIKLVQHDDDVDKFCWRFLVPGDGECVVLFAVVKLTCVLADDAGNAYLYTQYFELDSGNLVLNSATAKQLEWGTFEIFGIDPDDDVRTIVIESADLAEVETENEEEEDEEDINGGPSSQVPLRTHFAVRYSQCCAFSRNR